MGDCYDNCDKSLLKDFDPEHIVNRSGTFDYNGDTNLADACQNGIPYDGNQPQNLKLITAALNMDEFSCVSQDYGNIFNQSIGNNGISVSNTRKTNTSDQHIQYIPIAHLLHKDLPQDIHGVPPIETLQQYATSLCNFESSEPHSTESYIDEYIFGLDEGSDHVASVSPSNVSPNSILCGLMNAVPTSCSGVTSNPATYLPFLPTYLDDDDTELTSVLDLSPPVSESNGLIVDNLNSHFPSLNHTNSVSRPVYTDTHNGCPMDSHNNIHRSSVFASEFREDCHNSSLNSTVNEGNVNCLQAVKSSKSNPIFERELNGPKLHEVKNPPLSSQSCLQNDTNIMQASHYNSSPNLTQFKREKNNEISDMCLKKRQTANEVASSKMAENGKLPLKTIFKVAEAPLDLRDGFPSKQIQEKQVDIHRPRNTRRNVQKNDIVSKPKKITKAPKQRKPVQCDYCLFEFHDRHSLKVHLRIHTGDRPFKCEFCSKTFVDSCSLTQHRRKHTGEKPYQCEDCLRCFRLLSTLKSHQLTHTGQKPFKCECGAAFTQRNALKRHKVTHSDERPFVCEKCGKSFRIKHIYQKHLANHALKEKHTCGICGVGFNNNDKLTIHLMIHNSGDRPYKCNKCSSEFKLLKMLTQHKKRVHDHNYELRCEECDAAFRRKETYKAHLKVHKGENLSACHICKANFNHAGTLQKHIKSHEVKDTNRQSASVDSISCSRCHLSFFRPRQLKAHQKYCNPNQDSAIDDTLKEAATEEIRQDSLPSNSTSDAVPIDNNCQNADSSGFMTSPLLPWNNAYKILSAVFEVN